MTSVSRTAQFAKLHKVLKKCYKPAARVADRPVLEHLLFACCLEDAHYEAAEEAFAALVHTFFDWNEIRVTSIAELSEVAANLPDPRAAANRIKRILHSVFEANYSFDLEDLKKKNLGPTVKWLEKLDGATPFSAAYVVQAGLGGHSIPIDTGTMRVLRLLDLVTGKDAESGVVPGLERAVAKSKGVEFGSLLHQLGADFSANPFAPTVRDILLQINPDIRDNLPKRRAAQRPAPPAAPAAEEPKITAETKADSQSEHKKAPSEKPKKKAAEPAAQTPVKEQPAREENLAPHKEKPATHKEKQAAREEKPAAHKEKQAAHEEKPAAHKEKPPAREEKPESQKKKPDVPGKKPPAASPRLKEVEKEAEDAGIHRKKSATTGLAKRKPR
jgi:endonuclease III